MARPGTFAPGTTGNSKGRPKDEVDVKELAKAHTQEAIDRLVYWMKSDNAKASTSASTTLLDRGWGKPGQSITHGGEIKIPGLVVVDDDDKPVTS